MYKELLKLNIKKMNNSIKKQGKWDLNKYFAKTIHRYDGKQV